VSTTTARRRVPLFIEVSFLWISSSGLLIVRADAPGGTPFLGEPEG
jgi:hypothetical protein